MVTYNCTVVDKLEDFTILSQRDGSVSPTAAMSSCGTALPNAYHIGNYTVQLRNFTAPSDFESVLVNYRAVLELLYSNETYGSLYYSGEHPTSCYFNVSDNATLGYLCLEHKSILEFALWQYVVAKYSLAEPDGPPASFYNFSLDTTVAGLNGTYSMPVIDSLSNMTVPMQAIGAQCKSSSAVGFAEVVGSTSTYKSFTRADTMLVVNIDACPNRLALSIPQTLFPWDPNFLIYEVT